MKRFRLPSSLVLMVSLVSASLVGCAEREKVAEPVVADSAATQPTVAPVQKDYGNKFQGLKIHKPLGGTVVDKSGDKGAPAASAPAPADSAPAK